MDRKNGKKKLAWLLAALLLALCLPAMATEMTAEADAAAVKAGDTVSLTVTVKGENLAVVQGVYTYDPAVLTYTESDGGAADGFINLVSAEKGGSASLTARVTFTAAAAGTATVDFSLESVLDYDGKTLDNATASASVTIEAAPVEATPTPVPVDYSKTGVKAENVEGATADMYVWRSLEEVTIPSRYTETDLTYHEEAVKGATVPDSDAPVLYYLSDAAGENAGYYIYVPDADRFYPYTTLASVSKTYILMQPDASVQIPEGFTEGTLELDERTLTVWKATDAQGEICLVYARNPAGELGFYVYSADDASLQRYAVLPARPVQPQPTPTPLPATPAPTLTPELSAQPETAADNVPLTRVQFFALCGAALLFLLLFVISLVSHAAEKARRKRRAAERRAAREEKMDA